jgi:putative ATP-dependent endonuclease of the OLD family
MIYVSRLKTTNYRRLKEEQIPFKLHTVLIGENNAGKTSVLDLLDLTLNPTHRGTYLDEQDMTHGVDPMHNNIQAVIELRPSGNTKFSREERVVFDAHIDIQKNGNERLLVKLEYYYDGEEQAFKTQTQFIKSDEKDDGVFSNAFRQKIPLFHIPALRSASRDIASRSGTWSRIVGGVQMDPTKSKQVEKLATDAAAQIMQMILGEKKLSDTTTKFSELLKNVLWSTQDTGEISYSALPSDQREFLQAMQIMIKNPGDSQGVQILGHGEGTQSIAVVALMLAYVNVLGFADATIAVEEPENHLHPHATRSLVRYLWKRPQQTIITTHSTHVTDVVSPDEVVVLKRRGPITVARYIPDSYFSELELKELTRYIRTSGSEFFFSRSVLLVEGATETIALHIFAEVLGIDLDCLCITLLGVEGQNFEPFLKLFQPKALDTPYLIMCDNDKVAVDVANILNRMKITASSVTEKTIESNRQQLEKHGLFFLPKEDFEMFVMSEGHVAAYEQAIENIFGKGKLESYIKHRVASDKSYAGESREKQITDFIDRYKRKPELAYEVANIITDGGNNGTKIPPYFIKVIRAIESLARLQVDTASGNTPAKPK